MPRQAAVRSRSAPPSRTDRTRTFEDNENEDFPELPTEIEQIGDTPVWLRELSTLRSGRHSRASSIISTRTRFSTTTLDEVRSIEFTAGNQSFRISGYGSKVTEVTAPPPYSEPTWVLDVEDDDDANDHDGQSGARIGQQQAFEHHQEIPNLMDHEDTPGGTHVRGRGKRVRIVMPNEDDDEDGHGRGEDSPTSSQRVLTKADLYQLMWDLPLQLKRVLGLRSAAQAHSSILSSGDEQQKVNRGRPTSAQSLPDSFHLSGGAQLDVTSADTTGSHEDATPGSSTSKTSTDTLRPYNDKHDLRYPLTVMDLNELSQLYNRVIKDLDHEHRKQLHERDKEMAQLRSLLNEKDIVYRQQLRGKDFVIEDLKKQLDHNEDTMELRLEQARHEVEDLWEKRWKERDKHLMDRMKKIEEAGGVSRTAGKVEAVAEE